MDRCYVTPYAGVWIEISVIFHTQATGTGHSLRGSVDWNNFKQNGSNKGKCHSLRGSVDWNYDNSEAYTGRIRHSLRGSVDWNHKPRTDIRFWWVTPYAGVWIEIDKKGLQVTIAGGHSLRGSVDWNSQQ